MVMRLKSIKSIQPFALIFSCCYIKNVAMLSYRQTDQKGPTYPCVRTWHISAMKQSCFFPDCWLCSMMESFNLEGTDPYSKDWPGFNQFAAILISQRSTNLPGNQQQLAWPGIKSPPQPPMCILSNLSVWSAHQWQGLVRVPVITFGVIWAAISSPV